MNILKFGVAVMALLMVTSCVQEEVKTRKSGFVDPSSVVKGTMTDPRDGKN